MPSDTQQSNLEMNDSDVSRREDLSLSVLELVDRQCEAFEEAWLSGKGPRIESYVQGLVEPGRSALLHELRRIEEFYERRAGDAPSLPDEIPSTVLLQPNVVPARTNRYVTRKFHARGGMGEVWLADDPQINRVVALKRLRRGREELAERFGIEAQITGQLEHPSVVPVYDYGLDGEGQPFYVMKFVAGRTLQESIRAFHAPGQRPSPERELEFLRLIEVMIDLCHAVAFAHSRGVLHRDLKPDNVMLGPYGETFVLDWGLAKVLNQHESAAPNGSSHVRLTYPGGSSETVPGGVMGAPAYMAPEVAEGHTDEIDQRTDIYLLGSTLYEILTGNPPRKGSSHSQMIELARTTDPPSPQQLNRRIAKPLAAICQKAMAHRREDRYSTPIELADDIQRYLLGESVSAYPDGIFAKTWRFAKRHRTAISRAAVVLVLLTVSGAGVAFMLETKRLRLQELARTDEAIFRDKSDEARFNFANTDAPDERSPFFDPIRGKESANAALALLEKWGPTLEQFPLPDQQASLQQDMYGIYLLLLQSEIAGKPDQTNDLLAMLDRAKSLAHPTRSFYRLQAELLHRSGEHDKAAIATTFFKDERTPNTSLDYFLEGEQYRTKTRVPSAADSEDRDVVLPSRREHLEKAISHYRRALELAPKDYWARLQLGRCLLMTKQIQEADKELTACVAMQPDVQKAPWAYSIRGLALAQMSKFEQAERDLNLVIQTRPDFLAARLNRGVMFMLQKPPQFDKALIDFQVALQPTSGKPGLIEAALYRGQIELERGQYSAALADFDRMAAHRPDFSYVYDLRARTNFLLGREEAGLADVATLVRLDTSNQSAPDAGELFEKQGRQLRRIARSLRKPEVKRRVVQLALERLEKATAAGQKSPELFLELGLVLQMQGKWTAALAEYSKGLKLAPDNVRLRINRGWTYARDLKPTNPAAARDDFIAAIRVQPDNGEVLTALGYIEASEKTPADATSHAALALLHGASDSLVLHNVACIFAELSIAGGDGAAEYQFAAIAMLRRAAELDKTAIERMKRDPALQPLRNHPKYQQLLEDYSSP